MGNASLVIPDTRNAHRDDTDVKGNGARTILSHHF